MEKPCTTTPITSFHREGGNEWACAHHDQRVAGLSCCWPWGYPKVGIDQTKNSLLCENCAAYNNIIIFIHIVAKSFD
jgi:hypothetical protein